MATFLGDRPFTSLKQMKYEQLLERDPEWVKEVSKEELEAYLEKLQQRYLERLKELHPLYEEKLGLTFEVRQDLLQNNWMKFYQTVEEAQRLAREQALQEFLAA